MHPMQKMERRPCFSLACSPLYYHPVYTSSALEMMIDILKVSQIDWTSPSPPSTPVSEPRSLASYQEYSSRKGIYRGFCKLCGSTLTWRSDVSKEGIEVLLGSVDEEFLCKGEKGQEMGRELSRAVGGHFWCEKAVKGVTDSLREGEAGLFEWGDANQEMSNAV